MLSWDDFEEKEVKPPQQSEIKETAKVDLPEPYAPVQVKAP